jgi:hypothetical protein
MVTSVMRPLVSAGCDVDESMILSVLARPST